MPPPRRPKKTPGHPGATASRRGAKRWPVLVLRGLALFWLVVFVLYFIMVIWTRIRLDRTLESVKPPAPSPHGAPR